MPQPVLAAVIIAASISLFDLAALRRLFRVRKTEFALAVACGLGVAFVGVLEGIVIAVVLSVIYIFKRAWAPYSAVLGKAPSVPGFHDIRTLPGCAAGPGPAHRPLVRAALLRQCEPVPRPDPRAGEGGRSPAAVGPRRRRADHGHRHDRRGDADGPRPRAELGGDPSRVRRAPVRRTRHDRDVRAPRDHR